MPGKKQAAIEAGFGALATQTVISGIDLGLFQRLARGPAGAAVLARHARSDRRAVGMILAALTGMGQLERRGAKYCLPKAVKEMLRSPGVDPETFFADTSAHLKQLVGDWSHLTEVARTGRPVVKANSAESGGKFFPVLARRLFASNYRSAQVLARKLEAELGGRPIRILDVGAGSAAWSLPFAQANRRAEVVAFDFAPVLKVAMDFAARCGVEARYEFAAGDIRDARFGAAQYDLVILGHICHSEGAAGTRALFRKMHKALRDGGLMLVADFIADEKRTGAGIGQFPLLFALNMLVHSETGDTFTLHEYRAWAENAGFHGLRLIEIPAVSPIMCFRK